jgi:hypothetical protein
VNYVLLIYRALPPSEPIPESDDRAALAAHRALQKSVNARGNLHAVARLDEPARARTVQLKASGHEVMDGPYVDTKEWLVGFYLLDCATEDEAIAHGRALCNDEHHAIEVRPVTWRFEG